MVLDSRSILLVTPTLVSFRVFLRELAERMTDEGWNVHVATSSTNYPGGHRFEGNATIHEVDLPRGTNLRSYARAARQLRALVREIRPKLIHGHLHPGVLALAWSRRKDWPVTLGTFQGLVHPTLPKGLRRRFYFEVERWASRRLDAVWVLTEGDRASLSLPNVYLQESPGFGANPEVFNPDRFTPQDRSEQRRQWNVPENALVFIYVGRQTNFKGFPETAMATLNVMSKHPDVHIVLVGTSDPRHPDGLTPEVRQQFMHHSRVHQVGWTDDVARCLYSTDCLVFPSEREGMAVCIMEALSMGLPVVTTAARGCGELVQHGHNGWIVQRTVTDLTRQMLEICERPQERQQMAARALANRSAVSRTRYIVEQWRIYQRLLGSEGQANRFTSTAAQPVSEDSPACQE